MDNIEKFGLIKVVESLNLQNSVNDSTIATSSNLNRIEKSQLDTLDTIAKYIKKISDSLNIIFDKKSLRNVTPSINKNKIYDVDISGNTSISSSNKSNKIETQQLSGNTSISSFNKSNKIETQQLSGLGLIGKYIKDIKNITKNINGLLSGSSSKSFFNSSTYNSQSMSNMSTNSNESTTNVSNKFEGLSSLNANVITKGVILNLLPKSIIKSYVAGIQKLIDELSKIKTNDIKDAIEPLDKLGNALSNFSNINLLGSLASLAKLNVFIKGLKLFFKNAGSKENLKYLENIKDISTSLSPLKDISDSLNSFADIKWIKILFSSKGLKMFLNSFSKLSTAAIEKVSASIKKLADILEAPLKKLGNSLEQFGGKLGKVTGSLLKGALAMVALASSLIPLAIGLKMFKDVEWKSIAQAGVALVGLAGVAKLLEKSGPGALKGAGMIALLGAALIPLSFALNLLKDVGINTIGVLATGLTTLGIAAAAFGTFAPLIALGAGVMALLGASIIPMAYSLKMLSEIDGEKLTQLTEPLLGLAKTAASLVLAAPIFLASGLALLPFATGIKLLSTAIDGGSNMSDFLNKFGEFNEKLNPKKLFEAAGAILALSGAIAAFGAAQAAEGLGNFVGKFLRFGSDSPLEQMQKFAEIASPLNVASAAVATLADGIAKLGEMQAELSVLTDFPFDELEDLAAEIKGKSIIQIVLNGSSIESESIGQKSKDFSKMTNEEKAISAGYNTWEEYKNSNFKFKADNILPIENKMGATLSSVGAATSSANNIIVNNNSGGNISTVNTSNVNNTSAPPAPIITGSAMALF